MSYNGSGHFDINTAGQPVVTASTISSSDFNALTADLASGLSTAICKDGQTTITANLPMNNKKLTGLADGSARSDSATIGNAVDGTGVWGGTAGGTANALTISPSPAITAYATGQMFRFIVASSNTGAATLAVSGLSAKSITKLGTTALAASDLIAGNVALVVYDGTRFIVEAFNFASLASPVLSGTVTGTYTLGGTPTMSSQLNLTSGQIAFPATQVPSAGANVLDDYEEGTFTPSVGGTATYSVQLGYYTKIGDLVFIRIQMAISSIGTGSTTTISGLPFTAAYEHAIPVSSANNLAASVVSISGQLTGTTIVMRSRTAASASDSAVAVFGNSASVVISGAYKV